MLAAIRIFGHLPEDERSHVLGSKGARAVREVLIHVATLLPVVAGGLLIARAAGALYWLIPSEVISLYLSLDWRGSSTVAAVSATLAGLLFVGLTISLNHMLEGQGYLYRAWAALFLQFEALLIGLFALVPGQPVDILGGGIHRHRVGRARRHPHLRALLSGGRTVPCVGFEGSQSSARSAHSRRDLFFLSLTAGC